MADTDKYSNPNLPPSTPPVIDPAADPLSAAELSGDRGDAGVDGPAKSSFDRSAEDSAIGAGDKDEPGKTPDEVVPDEVVPDEGDVTQPTAPPEIEIERPDTDNPGQTPLETPMPPD